MKKRNGFTLIELVIVIAIIGILAMLVINSYFNVTNTAKVTTFDANCKIITAAYNMYIAKNNGDIPTSTTQLDSYIDGGFDSVVDNPRNAEYDLDGNGIHASYTDDKGVYHEFNYPNN